MATSDPPARGPQFEPSAPRIKQIVGTSAFDFVHPGYVSSSRRALGDMLAKRGASVILTTRVIRPGGGARVLHVSGQSLFHVPAGAGLAIHARDVAERCASRRAREILDL